MLTELKVYVSSTSVDLKEYRAAVIGALRKSGFFPVCMEDYVAQDKLPVDKCLSDVEQCDLYVGIFAWRYGFVPAGHEQSITELEYRKAAEKGIPALIFLLSEDAEWPSEFRDAQQDAARIAALRNEFKLGKMVGWFSANPHQLASEIQAALNRHEREILGARLDKLTAARYAEVSIADTPEQKASIQQAIVLVQEAMRQQSLKAQQTTCEPIPVSIPKLRGTFVDRVVERDTLFHCLRESDKSLVVIVAPGGYGKTELTTKVLKEIAPSMSIIADDIKGILYLRCVRGEITLGQIFSEGGRIAGRKQEFCDAYASKEMTLSRKLEYFFSELSKTGNVWLVMDNFEDLLDAGDDSIKDGELREFLETAVAVEHNVRIIVTSRAVPKFKGSRSAEKIDLSTGLPEDQAIKYLREEGKDYGLAEEDDAVLRAFVKRVHCIPKALESVLGYLEDHYGGGITLRSILADEDLFVDFDRHDLEKGLKSLVSRQFAVQSRDSQLVLSALSIFPKPVSNAALRYLLQGIGSTEFAELLTRLEKNRLVSQNHGAYDMHPVVRSFVYGLIPEGTSGDSEAGGMGKKETASVFTKARLHQRAAEFFKELRRPKAEWKTIEDLEPHLQEIHHLMKAGEYDAAARVLGIIDFDYLQLWGHARVVIELREQLLGKLRSTSLVRANAGNLGLVLKDTGRVREAIAYLEQALQSARDENNKHGIGTWLGNLGNAWSNLGETRKAIEHHEQALAISRETGNKPGEGADLGNLGGAWSNLGEARKAIEYYDQALAISREIGNKRSEGSDLSWLGRVWSDLGETRKAKEYFEQALTISREIGDRDREGSCLSMIGSDYMSLDEIEKAIGSFESALLIAQETGYRYGEGFRLECLAEANSLISQQSKALDLYGKALVIAREIERPELISETLYGLAFLHQYMGDSAKAEPLYVECLRLSVPATSYSAAVLLGILQLELGNRTAAQKNLALGMTLCEEALAKTPERYDARYALALCQLAMGNDTEALASYKEALGICNARGVVKMKLRRLEVLERASPNLSGLAECRGLLADATK